MIQKLKVPCYKCLDREPGCHGRCEKYTEWKENHQQLKNAEQKDKKDPAKTLLIENLKDRHEKWRKSHDTL